MLKIHPSPEASTIAVEFEGKATQEDARVLDNHVKAHFKDHETFNVLAVMHDIDGSTLKGAIEGVKFDTKRWNQFKKFAVVSEKKTVETSAELGNLLPGIKSKHFKKDELEAAWNWLKE
ncbi:STAS/SEC14 domain-containing protein [Alteribacillus sp. YIM 98480]|uniref:STAS/SEC14 domain-containing protein n=1 Tax=Alteribacillus sp. YIM 98480 TaxID=2606599 RepID=UPI001E3909AD|nr:STAS/SEC14 domain-containing protein [Alteribacillus sp. YIM 98480]